MIEKFKVIITTLGRERQITVYLPENYAISSKAYPGPLYARWTKFI
ncbi:hypothetical protein M4D55_07095 [Metabacillus idriensis]|nr:hypothetical protein [Metabacillus idriensis]MCM3595559.1 hypothetical protein [Metabacillus idriensis]